MRIPFSEIRSFLLNDVDLSQYDYNDTVKVVFLEYSEHVQEIEISSYISLNEYNERI